jgi:hypothetical protein
VPSVRRARRFTLPADHHDARTNERIEAFIEGPPRPVAKRGRRGLRRAHPPILLDDTTGWDAALRREDVRMARYGRAATVMVVDVAVTPAASLGEQPPPARLHDAVIDAIRNEARETDRVVRSATGRFRVLLPETEEADAARFGERLTGACRDRLDGHGGAVRIRIESLTPGHGRTLRDALDEVERQLEN